MTNNIELQLSDFDFELPEALIAQQPLAERCASRLLHVNRNPQAIQHQQFSTLLDVVEPGDVLVFNDTKVMPARLYGRKASGGKLECLIERVLSEQSALAHIRASKAPPVGCQLVLADAINVTVTGRVGDLFQLEFAGPHSVIQQLLAHGKIPLPPYIKREATEHDQQRYQTVYAKQLGAIAAPTAGLHFDQALLTRLDDKGVNLQKVTLHVGAGTFQPIRSQSLDDHQMHQESISVPASVCQAIATAKQQGNRIFAVGTTVVRCLEAAAQSGTLQPINTETQLFIRPGFKFNVIDALITNFHLPKSSLLLLVSAFAGYSLTMQCYRQAITKGYRFYSYGDAMLIT